MRHEDLVEYYPRLFHMAEAGTWPSIRKQGLLSTTALLDLFGINAEERFKIESCQRPKCFLISHPRLGDAVVRDQKPMSDKALRRCLQNMEPREWYETLNRKVFFWLTRERLLTLLSARAYRNREHCVLTLDRFLTVIRRFLP